ncbi:alkaline phosphatase [Paenibacillus odorifer]|jgi:membrane protein DedA with SNARE-associated domain|uniref:Alkaline phosphatase n=1 Tax=Paenibacillus odorifer TaxID=189426 RepID=A0ABX3GS90_9BACL|nr:DedA family protein [Paenibacillus odorifer]OMC76845.1 alkaline phosphatase [Paenibacillus odorifer]OMD33927.1 alkaline phosphatase [Paenibacillus odorifer]OMD63920.1 alkaline phosphatase [Paenibacillus odorifer]OMD79110.1 alkaline phosphatase [Paenibacillus odorifer]OMD93732.1 alkaline phosphatase [Paenibacillus odorifer]
MQAWITDFMEQFGYFGIFLMLAFENIFPPIPSEVILPFGGFMTTTTSLTIPGVIIAATAGSLLGAVILYYIGRLLDVSRLEKLVERWGSLIRVSKKDIHKADAWFDKYGYWTVLFCRMVPLVRSLISIPAGMSGMKFGVFMIFTTIGTLGWNLLLVLIGAALGESWEDIAMYMDVYSNVVYVLIAGGLVILGFLYFRKRSRRMNTEG